jgi:uncharacterized membrane protein
MMKLILLGPVALLLVACGETSGSTSSTATGGAGGGDAGSCPNDLPASCPSPAPEWAADVAKVIAARCAICHSAGGAAADKPLTDHADVFARKGAVLNQIHACKMPPEGATPLTAAERVALEGWLVCGAADN